MVSTACGEIDEYAHGRSRTRNKLVKADFKILYHAFRKHLIMGRKCALVWWYKQTKYVNFVD